MKVYVIYENAGKLKPFAQSYSTRSGREFSTKAAAKEYLAKNYRVGDSDFDLYIEEMEVE